MLFRSDLFSAKNDLALNGTHGKDNQRGNVTFDDLEKAKINHDVLRKGDCK
jgi:hypothetical protein